MKSARPHRIVLAGRLSAIVGAALVCARASADPDLWGHLTFGADILNSGSVHATDPYSFTHDVPWINHEWLSETIFAGVYRLGALPGLAVLKTIIVGTALAIAWSILKPIEAQSGRWWLCAILPFAIAPAATTFRPQLWSLLALAVLLNMHARGGLRWRVIPLFAFWANLHGGWIVGAGVMAALVVGNVLDGAPARDISMMVLASVASVGATLLNPYGIGLWQFLAGTVRMTREITEWRPLWQQADLSHGVIWGVVAGVSLWTMIRRWTQLPWAAVIPACGLGVAALFVDRLGPLFALVASLLWKNGWFEGARKAPTAGAIAAPSRSLLVDGAAVGAVWLIAVTATSRCLPISGTWAPDLQAASALMAPAARGRLVLPFDWGEFAIWHFGPRLLVSIDGRRETIYSEATLAQQDAVAAGTPVGVAYLLRERPDYVWLKRSAEPVRAALAVNGYRIDVQTSESFIAVKSSLPTLNVGQPMSACFP